ncbi:MAG: hypothetical protein JWQ98_1906 [Chlorobi bacterium]|nr:hypothetical protein [Chlorobiota bacterium]
MRRILLTFLSALALSVPALGQGKLPQSLGEFYSYGDNYFIEAATMPGMTPGKGRAIISFRLVYDLLNFRKTLQPYQRSNLFVSTPSMYAEAVNSDGVIVDRGTWTDTVRLGDYARTNSKSDYVCGSVELALRPDVYTIKYYFNDGTPDQGFSRSLPPMKMDDFSSPSPAIGVPVMLRNMSGDTLVAAGIDGAIPFGRRFRVYVPLSSPEQPKALRFELQSVPKKPTGPTPTVAAGSGTILGNVTLSHPMPYGSDNIFFVRHAGADTSVPRVSFGALLDASADDLDVGEYLLLMTYEAGFNTVTDSVRLKLSWPEMPFTYSRTDYAIRALYPIATEETIDSLMSGDPAQQRAMLEAFWKRLDPTPATRYNEKLAEYYRRVDYSYFNFKSIGQGDGTFTDMGKIYILNGPPTDVSREMRPDALPREIWTYRNAVGRKFVFTDEAKTGEYRLVEYNDL